LRKRVSTKLSKSSISTLLKFLRMFFIVLSCRSLVIMLLFGRTRPFPDTILVSEGSRLTSVPPFLSFYCSKEE
jgi:hypothetical protein